MTWIIGITGGVGSGKSEILKYIGEKCNCQIVLSDLVAKEMYQPGSECFDKIIHILGEDILDEHGRVIHSRMAEKIFADESLLAKINQIVHPAVIQSLHRQIQSAREENSLEFFFVESALLIEAHFDEVCDELWYIYTDEKVRRDRLKISRNYSDEKINQIMANQLSEKVFREKCSHIIDNSGLLEDSKKQIDAVLEAHRCQR